MLRSFLYIIRLPNDILLGLVTVTGYIIGGGRDLYTSALLFLTAFFAGAGSFLANDYFDLEVDRRKGRPAALGSFPPSLLLPLSLLFSFLSLLLSYLLSPLHLLFTLSLLFLSFLYSWRLGKNKVIGNHIVALVSSASLLFGGLSSNVFPVLPPFLVSYLASVAREIVKDMEDYELGEREKLHLVDVLGRGAGLIASLYVLSALLVSLLSAPLFSLLFLFLLPLPTVSFIFSLYLVMRGRYGEAQRWMKWGMFLGLLAFLGGSLWG